MTKGQRKLPAGRIFPFFLIGMLLIFIAGCTRTANESALSPQFVPPTLVPTPLPTVALLIPGSEAAQVAETSGETTNCLDGLTFISDMTIPDDTVVVPGSSMDKRWEVENSGTCNWEQGYELRMISGDAMGAESTQALPPARSGARITIRILFSAPTTPGTYRADWQAYNPAGEPFGEAFYLQIVVQN
jgi:hypothetical protein